VSKREGAVAESFRITFTSKPKGFRANAVLTRDLRTNKVQYIRVGYDEELKTVHLQPVKKPADGFKVVFAKANSCQVNSSLLWHWIAEMGLAKASLIGTWDAKTKSYVFVLETMTEAE